MPLATVQKPRRLILTCDLCLPTGLFVEPSCEDVLPAAYDHALEHHLPELIADHEIALSKMRVAC